jgi:hypothetical protein
MDRTFQKNALKPNLKLLYQYISLGKQHQFYQKISFI